MNSNTPSAPAMHWRTVLLTGLALSVGWGVRGQWGHEFGAMIPGALAAMAVALLSGRADWQRRVAYFAFFGAVGWSFGGSMSYMQVVGYTHSGHPASQLYGFACLFAIGFLWAAPGGAGTALPAVLDRERLTALFIPVLAIFGAWFLQWLSFRLLFSFGGDELREQVRGLTQWNEWRGIEWVDTEWMAATTAIVAVLIVAIARRKLDWGSSLALHMAAGWWVGLAALVIGLGLRMTPPRSDNWAGSIGLVAGMLVFFLRHGMHRIVFASLVAGFIGGLGFSGVQALKLLGIALSDAYPTNWHSLLEQGYGFVNGIGIAIAIGWLASRSPEVEDEPPVRPWTGSIAVGFVLLFITFVNIRKNVSAVWLPGKILPEEMYGLSATAWFNLAYLAIAAVTLALIVRHSRRPLALVPADPLGRGQLLFIAFLWWIVLGNAARAFPFAPQRMVTEGVIHLSALACTLLVAWGPRAEYRPQFEGSTVRFGRAWLAAAVLGLIVAAGSITAEYGLARKFFTEEFYSDDSKRFAGVNVRFGPDATTGRE